MKSTTRQFQFFSTSSEFLNLLISLFPSFILASLQSSASFSLCPSVYLFFWFTCFLPVPSYFLRKIRIGPLQNPIGFRFPPVHLHAERSVCDRRNFAVKETFFLPLTFHPFTYAFHWRRRKKRGGIKGTCRGDRHLQMNLPHHKAENELRQPEKKMQ